MKIVYNVNVWGKEFVDFFANICLASQLVGNNLDFLSKKTEITFLICTKRKDVDYLKESKFFQKLYDLGTVKIVEIDSFFIKEKFVMQTICYQLAAQEGLQLDCPVLYMCPDMLCSQNFLKMLYESVQKGKRAFLFYPFRLSKSKVLKKLSQLPDFSEKGISVQNLVKLAFDNLNNETSAYFLEKYKICFSQPMLWELDKDVYLLKAFGAHPLLIWPDQKVLPQTAVDDHYVYHSISSWDLVEMCENTNQAGIFEVSFDSDIYIRKIPISAFFVSRWAKKTADPYRVKMFYHDFFFNVQPLQREKCVKKLLKIKKFEKRLLKYLPLKLSFFTYLLTILVRLRFFREAVRMVVPNRTKEWLKKIFYRNVKQDNWKSILLQKLFNRYRKYEES